MMIFGQIDNKSNGTGKKSSDKDMSFFVLTTMRWYNNGQSGKKSFAATTISQEKGLLLQKQSVRKKSFAATVGWMG